MKSSRLLHKLSTMTLVLGLLLSPSVWAQAKGDSKESDTDEVSFDAKDAFGTILVAGLVGGIIGLSTLPFYSQPSKHVKNITLGAGAGMIGSALYMTFDLANNKPKDKDEDASLFNRNWILAPAWDPSHPKNIGMDFTYLFN